MVISGPDATAGSILIFLKNIGISVPTALETAIAISNASPIHPDAEKAKIAAKEDQWDIELQNISTELSAINTEIDSVKALIEDAISIFDWGS